MQRVTMTFDDDLMAEIDRFAAAHGYQNRSEAFRDLARAGLLETRAETSGTGQSVGALIYVYDHDLRELPKRLTETHHGHHNLSVATMHVHLDRDTCLEVALLRGPTAAVRHHAGHVIAERGVRHGRLVLVPVEGEREALPEGDPGGHRHGHRRSREG